MTGYETTTVDAKDRLEAIEAQQEVVAAEAGEADLDSEAYRELAEEYEELEHARETLVQRFEEWDGSEFTIKKFGYADEAHVDDLLRADMIRDDEDDPRTKLSAYKVRTIQVGVVKSPPDCPDDPKHPSFPPTLGEWLYERIDHFNRFGDTSLEDFSLSRRLDDEPEPTN